MQARVIRKHIEMLLTRNCIECRRIIDPQSTRMTMIAVQHPCYTTTWPDAITQYYNFACFFLGRDFRWDTYLLENRYNPVCLRYWARFGERELVYIQNNHEDSSVYGNIDNILPYVRRQPRRKVGNPFIDPELRAEFGYSD